MTFATVLTRIAAELALFSAVGFLLFAVNDLAVDLIYFGRRFWRSATVYRRFPRTFGRTLADRPDEQKFTAAAVRPSPCSQRAASTSGRCRGASISTPISRPESSE